MRNTSSRSYRASDAIALHIDLEQAKSRLEELIERVAHGEDVVITKSDQPVARLSAIEGKRQRQFGSVKGQIWMSDDFDEPLEDFREYM